MGKTDIQDTRLLFHAPILMQEHKGINMKTILAVLYLFLYLC